jgi:hypothetical protein
MAPPVVFVPSDITHRESCPPPAFAALEVGLLASPGHGRVIVSTDGPDLLVGDRGLNDLPLHTLQRKPRYLYHPPSIRALLPSSWRPVVLPRTTGARGGG